MVTQKGVAMKPIFVRHLLKKERQELKKLLNSSNTRLYKRARVVWLSTNQHLKAPEIAKIVDLHLNKVRKYIRRFNQEGIMGLYQKPSPGRPREIGDKKRRQIIKLLKTKPRVFGLSWSSWNLRGLAEVTVKQKLLKSISHEYIRKIIEEEGYSYKRSKRWITSPDPEYDFKKNALRKSLGIWTKEKR